MDAIATVMSSFSSEIENCSLAEAWLLQSGLTGPAATPGDFDL